MYMNALPLPHSDQADFSILYHLTSLENAEKILNSLIIYGCDGERHANFSAIIKRPDIAKFKDVCLRFKWNGSQAMYFGDPFGHGEPICQSLSKPILHHIFSDSQLLPRERLRSKKYWQSNLYPGSSGLIFDGIEKIHEEPPVIPKKPCRLRFWDYEEKTMRFERVNARHEQIAKLITLAQSKVNCSLSVP